MKIEVAEATTGLLLVHVLGKERLACEAAHNRFLLSHNLKHWNLIVRKNLIDLSLMGQSINPNDEPSGEVVIAETSAIRTQLTELLEAEWRQWETAMSDPRSDFLPDQRGIASPAE